MTRKTTKPFSGRITAPSAPWLAPEVDESPEPSDRRKADVKFKLLIFIYHQSNLAAILM